MRFRWSVAPDDATALQKKNFANVQADAIGVGLASAAATFLPVFLARLGATSFQVGLLTSMPALTGLLLAILIGQFLQNRGNIVPWFASARLLVILSYTLTGVVSLVLPQQYSVPAVLLIWAVATVPQTVVNISFSVVTSAVAGPAGRYALMSRRWSILGLTSAITVTLVGRVLDRLGFPLNYQLAFISLSIGGLISYYYSSRIEIPGSTPPPRTSGLSLRQRLRGYSNLVRGERAFVSFMAKRFVYLMGSTLAVPLFPIYYVHEVQASDAWIGIISSAQTAVTLIGYIIWARQGKARGSRFVLVWTTFGLSTYPILVAFTRRVEMIAFYAGLAGIFQAGLNLVFFDELMKTVPVEHSATFVSIAHSMRYIPTMVAPLLGTLLAEHIGIGGALVISGVVRLMGFGLFAWDRDKVHFIKRRRREASP